MRKMMAMVLGQTMLHFTRELCIAVQSKVVTDSRIDLFPLRDITAVGCFGPPYDVMIVFTFDYSVAEHVESVETRGLRIDPTDLALLLRETMAETINVILGRCTTDLSTDNTPLSLSAPVVTEGYRQIRRPASGEFHRVKLETVFGSFDIAFIYPKSLFDQELNLVEP